MSNTIELKAVYGKQQGPFTACPVKDKDTGKLLGVKNLTPEEKFKHPRPVEENTTRKITDGVVLNLDDVVDATDWEWIKHNKEIASSFEEGRDSPNALYYIFTPDKEVNERIKKKENVFEALKIVHGANKIEREEISRLLGVNVSEYDPKDVLDSLIDRAERTPEKIIEAYNDPFKEEKMFLYGLLDNRLINKDSNGVYRYGDIVLGLNIDSALRWLGDEKNREITGRLYAKLNQSRVSITVPKNSFINELKEEAKRNSEQMNAQNTDTSGGESE